MILKIKSRIRLLIITLGLIMSLPAIAFAQTDAAQNAKIDANNVGLATIVAPGDFLPISVALSNFGNSAEIDVLISYSIMTAAGEEIASTSETVAVQTTASFIKTIQIPFNAPPGTYTALTSVTYKGQLTPATSQFTFTVERRIFGLFESDFYLYGVITIAIAACVLLLSYLLIERRRKARLTPFDYSDIPRTERTFYEIVSDTIMAMRQRVGDDALLIASRIDGLSIDTETGKVLALTRPPAQVIARLVSEYENHLGKKVSFSFRKDETDA